MSEGVDAPWTEDIGIREYTDTDLEATRVMWMAVSDPDGSFRRMAETLTRREGIDNYSVICDRALRVELAYVIDENEVFFDRDEYDVAYTLPPASWVRQQQWKETELVPESEVDAVAGGRSVQFSTPHVAHEMAKQAVDDEAYSQLSDITEAGVERMLGQR